MIEFKLVSKNDLEIVKNIAVKAFKADLEKYGSMPPGIEGIQWHEEKINDGNYYKILFDDQIVGAMKIYDKDNGHFHLGALFIDPIFQNQGVGSEAMYFLNKTFNQAGRWTLDTPYKNYRNHYFYEKHGFKKIDEFKPESDKAFTLYLYEKKWIIK